MSSDEESAVSTEGGPYNGGAHTNCQGSGYEEAGKLAALGGNSLEEVEVEQNLVYCTSQAAIPTDICV